MAEISIIIPTIGKQPDLVRLQRALKDIDYEIIVELDEGKEGKGLTLQRGFAKSTGKRIVWIDADFQIAPEHIKSFLDIKVDCVIGSKLHPLSTINYSPIRRVITWFSCVICRLMFNLPLRDTQTGLKVFLREILDREWQVKGFGHDIEVLSWAYNNGYKIVEMPVSISKAPESSVNLKACFKTFYEMLWLKYQLLLPKKSRT